MLSKSWVFLCCQFWLYFLLNLIFVERVKAQIIPDTTLNSEISIINSIDEFNERINGGALRGTNLFHSFKEFNVGEGKGVVFANPDGINNIFSRVTGNNPSNILGKLGVSGTANLFLINPNGIVFGENATLDVQGSFVATTADAIRFGEGGLFSAREPRLPSQLLNVNPSALLFNQITSSSITNNSQTSLESSSSEFGLQVPNGKSLLLIGGDVNINGGRLMASGGRIEIGAVAGNGNVKLNSSGRNLRLNFPDNVLRANISISNNSVVDVTADGRGSIVINSRNLDVSERSIISAGVSVDNPSVGIKPGDIILNVTEIIRSKNSFISNFIRRNSNQSNFASIQNSGNLTINTTQLLVEDGSQVGTTTLAKGNAGNVTINSSESVQIIGISPDNRFFSTIASQSGRGPTGNAGTLTINTKKLLVKGGATVSTSTFGEGKGGNSIINASESVRVIGTSADSQIFSAIGAQTGSGVTGNAGDLSISTGKLIVRNGGQISAGTFGTGEGGNINIKASEFTQIIGRSPDGMLGSGIFVQADPASSGKAGELNITTRNLLIQNGANISASTFGKGNGGKLTIDASESVRVTGLSFDNQFASLITVSATSNSAGQAGDLSIKTQQLLVQDGAQITANTFKEDGSNINIWTDILTLSNSGQISAQSRGSGKAGDITISVNKVLNSTNGNITTATTQSSGGSIKIVAPNIRLFGDSDIATNVFSGMGGGGNIDLTADTIVALDDSDILSFARDGQGGDITFNTAGFFSSSQFRPTSAPINLNQLNGNNRVDINASGAISGNITGIPDTTFIQNSLNELPENQIDTGALIANSCIVRVEDSGSTFLITGSGGFPHSPGNADISNYSTGKVRSISNHQKSPPWKKGDPIMEPQGVFRLPNGKLLLSQKCN